MRDWAAESSSMTEPRVPLRIPQRAVVSSADSAIADTEFAVAELERFGSQSTGSQHQLARSVVEFADIVATVGKHDGTGEVTPGRLPPVFEESALG